jgi:alpha-mannosidase
VRQTKGEFEHEVTRFETQARFAEWLCQQHGASAGRTPATIARARDGVAQSAAAGSLKDLRQAVRQAEAALVPWAALARSYTLRLVGHAHIDMNWMWSWPETVAVTVDSMRTVLHLMDEFPEFRFSQSQASIYRILEEHAPDLLAAIRQRVHAGRWEVTASHWVEGDKNLAGGESLCRQVLYARQYMHELFGLTPEDVNIDWSPDTFGHAATVPTYLAQAGVRYLYLHRPGLWGPPKPEAFWWQGPDGARVLVLNDVKRGYNGQIRPHVIDHLMTFCAGAGVRETHFVFGVGDHGGGPTRQDLLWAQELAQWPIMPAIRHATVREAFEALAQRGGGLPVVRGELNSEFTGCYTTQSLIKRSNRYGETRLADAECAAALAAGAAGYAYPQPAFRDGWRDVLFSHFHDILPGSGVRDTRTYAHGLFQKTMAMSGQRLSQALRAIARRVDTRNWKHPWAQELIDQGTPGGVGGGAGHATAEGALSSLEQSTVSGLHPVLLFNPTAWARREVLELTVWDNAVPACLSQAPVRLRERAFLVLDSNGHPVPHQVVAQRTSWGHDCAVLAVPVDLPAFGYARYAVMDAPPESVPASQQTPSARATASAGKRLVKQIGWSHHCPYAFVERSPEGLENDLVHVEIDTQTGGIRRLLHKRSGQELIRPDRPAPLLEYARERAHGMTAWSVDHMGPAEALTLVSLNRGEAGPLKAVLTASFQHGHSTVEVRYELRAGDPRLYLGVRAKWLESSSRNEPLPVLRLTLPLALDQARGRYEIPLGAVDREQHEGEEVPALQWAQVTGKTPKGKAGILLINDCKHGHGLTGNVLHLTLFRSSSDPDPFPELVEHEINLAIMPFAGTLSAAQATRLARELNHPLRVMTTDVHKGSLPGRAGFLTVEPAELRVDGQRREAGRGRPGADRPRV